MEVAQACAAGMPADQVLRALQSQEPILVHARRSAKAASAMGGMKIVDKDVPPPSPTKPKLTAEERRVRQKDRLTTIRLRMAIGRELDDRGITEPAEIGAALGLPAVEATKLLTRHQWREDDVALLTAAAARLGLPTGGVPARDCDRDDDRQ